MQAIQQAEDNTTVGELRLACQKLIDRQKATGIEDRETPQAASEKICKYGNDVPQPFSIMAHRPNYFLGASYNAKGYDASYFQAQFKDPDYSLDDIEAKFQISIKLPLLVNILDTADLYAAYTNRSFWQVYNTTESSPFREINHEPEIWLQLHPQWEFFHFINSWDSIGFNHQSNGRDGPLSRSWNRLFASFTFEHAFGDDKLTLTVKPWVALVDTNKGADNPDITDYLGHYEVSTSYRHKKNVFTIMSRNNLESGFKRGAVELSWSFPFFKWPYLRGYLQYFTGYGESLVDYNQYTNTIGFGVLLTDWL